MLIALAFEFVNGFHDTANAVATVIYTRSLPVPRGGGMVGTFNLLGVLSSSGAVAFGIVSLLPVELILQVGQQRRLCDGFRVSDRGDHLETSEPGGSACQHRVPDTLIGSIIGVGITNALLHGRSGTSGSIGQKRPRSSATRPLSPLFGFVLPPPC